MNRGDIDAMLAMADPNVELLPSLVGGVEGTTYRGRAGYRSWFEQQLETYDQISFELHDIRAVGDQVVALYTTRIRGARSGIELEARGGTVFTIQAGLLTRQVGYQSAADALAAVDLAE